MKVYLASSWRNIYHGGVLKELQWAFDDNIDFYNFKNPSPGDHGFNWKQLSPNPENWTTDEYIKILKHPISEAAFKNDFDAMRAADACVLLLPCGRSAHIEAGYFIGANKPLIIYIPELKTEPKLMYKMTPYVFSNLKGVVETLQDILTVKQMKSLESSNDCPRCCGGGILGGLDCPTCQGSGHIDDTVEMSAAEIMKREAGFTTAATITEAGIEEYKRRTAERESRIPEFPALNLDIFGDDTEKD